jgi:hypothetical protein
VPQHLRNIKTRRISLVDRAAVRDPANPTQPRTFALLTADSEKGTSMGTFQSESPQATAPDNPFTADEKSKLAAAAALLHDGEHAQLQALASKVDAIAGAAHEPGDSTEGPGAHPTGTGEVLKTDNEREERMTANADIETLRKHENYRVRELIAKADEMPPGAAVALARIKAEEVGLQKADPTMTDYAAKERVRRDRPDLMREYSEATRGPAPQAAAA